MTVGYLPHAFDLLNVADIELVRQARGFCDRLVVGVLSDEAVEDLTGRPPVVPLSERLTLVGHLRGVDLALLHHDADQTGSVPDGAIRFAVTAGGLVDAGSVPADVVLLSPARESRSAVLRDALRSVREDDVA